MPIRLRARAPVLLALLGGLTELALLILWQRNAYWNFSDGVYAQSAREFLHGVVPYRDFAAAQPPPVFLAGALLLALSDSSAALHVGLGLVNLFTSGLVGVCVWRLDGRTWPGLLAVGVSPLLPISLSGHGQLLPETLAAPLILAGAMLCARADRQLLGACVLALAVWCKLAFLIPALLITLVSPVRRRTLTTMVAATALLMAGSIVMFGTGVWRETMIAQLQVGHASLHYGAGLFAQAAWNELPLLIGCAMFLLVASRERERSQAPPLARTLTAAAVGGLLLILTMFKRGSYIDVLIVAEPPLLVLGVCGAARSWTHSTGARVIASLAAMLLLAQSASLLVHPADPWAAVRPFARSGLAWQAGPAAVSHAVMAARRCPSQLAYGGDPYIAFLADRRMPGGQPDLFMLQNAAEDAAFARRADHDRPVCP